MKKPDRKLNDKQIEILKLAYIFRYLTTDNLAKLRNITHNSAYSALTILTQRGYLGRKHHKSYRLMNKSARYYLTPEAVKLLKLPEYGLDADVLQTRRYEDKKSSSFIDLQVEICKAYTELQDQVTKEVDILTATNMTQFERDNYLKPYPSLELHHTTNDSHILVDIIPKDQHLFIAKKRIRKYIEHYDGGDWEWDTYPDVYIVRKSPAEVKQLNKYIEEKMEEAYLDDSDFKICAIKEVLEIPKL